MNFKAKTVPPIIGVLIALIVNIIVPNNKKLKYADLPHYRYFLIIALVVTVLLALVSLFNEKLRERYSYRGFFIGGVFIFLTLLDLVTSKFLLLPQLYFPSIARIFNVFFEDKTLLLECIRSSFLLLIKGITIGFILGMACGIAVGWSKNANYWIYPLIRILGPIPSSTWTPLALVVFPSAQGAAVFLIAFGVWFQITILTCSGIQSVKKAYFEVSSTLGASNLQNLFKIAVPAAAPSIFLGFFNATCSSFVALMAAEMIGCKSGLGWYVNWQKTMLSYPNVYAGLIVVAIFCYILVTIQFKVRDRLLSWQEGVVKW
ncbi:ABC transporter permease [Butyrivibrio sp. YAB3001]|uniref:ABC transporter permease n=1 Tax=Butyrivibrio sp. YAB3001 TaxID=1520812 RepID=UPI0008F65247|nr:ABC transporter permease subunit [Butyrivibrio sp. YAB3001]SFB85259.1 NitT/TauT family transport system permease protein [Butyrivibrio sp. YAB3001]